MSDYQGMRDLMRSTIGHRIMNADWEREGARLILDDGRIIDFDPAWRQDYEADLDVSEPWEGPDVPWQPPPPPGRAEPFEELLVNTYGAEVTALILADDITVDEAKARVAARTLPPPLRVNS